MEFKEYYYVSNGCPMNTQYLILKAANKKEAKTMAIEYWDDNEPESKKAYYTIRFDRLMEKESVNNILEFPIY